MQLNSLKATSATAKLLNSEPRPLEWRRQASHGVRIKSFLHAIPVEVLALAVIEFVFMSTFAAVLWYVLSHK